jgi:hypothetical protein
MMGDDDAPDTSSPSSAYTSSRQAMEQVMDAVVDADVDVAIPQLSQPSQLSSVSLEANEAPARSPTGNKITTTYKISINMMTVRDISYRPMALTSIDDGSMSAEDENDLSQLSQLSFADKADDVISTTATGICALSDYY